MSPVRRLGALVVLILLPALTVASPADAATAGAPVSALHFEAIPRIGGNWPGDPTGAMGETTIVTAVNTSVAVHDLAGTAVLGPISFRAFRSFPPGTRVFDPKVVYDQYVQVFVLAFLAVNDGLRKSWVVVVSIPGATAADQTTWCTRQIGADRVKGDGRQWADYLGLGYDLDRVAVTTNQFNFGGTQGYAYAQILSFPKTTLYECAQAVAFGVFAGAATRNPGGTKAFTIQPATSVGANPADQYFLSFQKNVATDSAVIVWRLRETMPGLKLSKASLDVARVSISPFGTQGDGTGNSSTWWDPGDLRLVNAFYDADLNRVYAAHTIFRDLKPDTNTGGYAESVIRWYEVAPESVLTSSTVARTGVVGTPETDAGWPVVGTDGSGNLFVTYSRASRITGEYLSAYVAEVAPGSTTAEIVLLAAGTARMETGKGPERWGDYNGISRSPLDPAVMAVVNQYAKSDGSGPTADWQQTVDLVRHL
ncbi:MAG: hypothetical protein ACRDHS_01395 [Actinomycetota bacterium]